MFERSYLKELSKQRLHTGRGSAILVLLIAALLGGGAYTFSGGFRSTIDVDDIRDIGNISSFQLNRFSREILEFFREWWPVIFGAAAVAAVIGILYTVLVANVIKVGARGWFLRYWRGELPSVGELFASFRIYAPSVTTMLLKDIYTFLWSLLFIIPGIVKGYAYSMAEYIIYENPNLSGNDAITLSRRLTQGAKWDLFVFDLSYIGWDLLNSLTFGILGLVHVNPYRYTAHAAVYQSLKATAIQSGRMTWQDFGQIPPAAPAPEA